MSKDIVNRRLFGTDGIRGVANTYPMVPELVLKLGKAVVYLLKKINNVDKPKIVVGKDTRLSGYMLEQSITAGFTTMGADVILVGPLPSPGIAYITRNMRADAGVVISASHNPYEDNGIKFFNSNGFKLSDSKESEIEKLVFSDKLDKLHSPTNAIGKVKRIDDAQGRYIAYVKDTFPKDLSLNGIKIVVDCANGASYKVAPTIFKELGAEVIEIAVSPNGNNINYGCGSMHPELISKTVIENGADIGIALDGDADRVVFCDDKGGIVDGDEIIAVCADELKAKGLLKNNTLVVTEMSNMALDDFTNNRGITLLRTPVGDRYVVDRMNNGAFNFGGEKSGHLIFMDYSTTGDGALAALQILSIMKRYGKNLGELTGILDLYPQKLTNVRVMEKIPIEDIHGFKDVLQKNEQKLNGKGRINVRYSGTEPILRLMVEAQNHDIIDEITTELAFCVMQSIGVSNA